MRRGPHAIGVASRPVFVDSGGWIAWVSRQDAHHAEADAMFRRAAVLGTRLLTTNLVVVEVQRFVLFRAGIQAAALARMDASRLVTIEFATAAHHREAQEWLSRFADQRVSYADAVGFAVMKATRCRAVIGFDHHFVLAGFERWRPPQ